MDVIKTGLLFALFDVIWLGMIRKNDIRSFFTTVNCNDAGQAQSQSKSWHLSPIILLVWLLMAFAIENFVIIETLSRSQAGAKGAILGLIVYGVYNLTNVSTITRWSWPYLIIDVMWGIALTALVALIRWRIVY